MMTAREVIEAYVRDVARYLPREKRNDVAFELRGLLNDELTLKSAAEGHEADHAMAMSLLTAYGRPAETAARYQPPVALIDPADTRDFLIWSVVGSLFFSIARRGDDHAWLQWVGIVFLYFAIVAWLRRRKPSQRLEWRPKRERFPESGGRGYALSSAVATLIFPFAMYLAPQTWWEVATLGKLPSSGLALTDAFLQSWQRIVTLTALAFVAATYATASAQRGWRRSTRRALIFGYSVIGVMFLVHAAPLFTLLNRETFAIFNSAIANKVAMPIFGGVGAIILLGVVYDAYSEWARVSPAPTFDQAAPA